MSLPNAYTLRLLRVQSHHLTHEISLTPAEAAFWKPAPGEWSVQECLAHLRNIERNVYRARITRVVEEDQPALPYFDESAYHGDHYDPYEPVETLLAEFVADRAAEAALLERADWSRTGLHAVRGPLSLAWLADYAVNHTWEHLSQIMRVRLDYQARR